MVEPVPLSPVSVSEKVKRALTDFFRSLGRDKIDEINDETNLIEGTGASSDEGVDFAIDITDGVGCRRSRRLQSLHVHLRPVSEE